MLEDIIETMRKDDGAAPDGQVSGIVLRSEPETWVGFKERNSGGAPDRDFGWPSSSSPDVVANFKITLSADGHAPAWSEASAGCRVLNQAALLALSSRTRIEEWWEDLGRQGIVSLIGVSRAGFDAMHSEALVYYSLACGPLCGRGMVARLVRGRDGWRITGQVMVWIA